MSLLTLVPSTIKVVIASALGRPRFKSRLKSGESLLDETEDAGLKSIAPAPSHQFHGYIEGSGGLVDVADIASKPIDPSILPV